MSANLSRIARKHVNVLDRVQVPVAVPVPGFTVIRRVDGQVEQRDFIREKVRPTGSFWAEWNDLTLGDLAGTAK